MSRLRSKASKAIKKSVILTLFFLLVLLKIAFLTGPAFAANSPPSIGTLTPSGGTSAPNQAVSFTTTYTDPDGYSDMRDIYLIINSGITGLQGFYGFYDQIHNKLYLINDQANGWLGGYAPGSSNVIENSFVKLDCSQSSVSGSGTTLTITWNVTFKPCFTGYKNIYLFARDYSLATSGWVRKGSWTLANAYPSVGTITPSSGSSLPEEAVTFTTTYTDPNGFLNLNLCHFLVNTYPSFSKCLYAYYDQNLNWLYLRNDTNTGWLGGFNPGSDNIIENSYAKIDCSQTTVSGSGTTLTIAWRIIFKSSFAGNKNCYLYVKDDAGAPQGWKQKGTWTITNTAPAVGTVTPSSGSLSHNQAYDFTTTFTDPDGYLNIWQNYLIINSGITGLQGFYGFYDQSTNKLYLINDQANRWLGGYAPGSGNVIENSFVKLDCSRSSVSVSGTTLTITWNITFKPCFTGTKNAYLYMRDFAYATGGWMQKASFSLPNHPPSVGTVTPSNGSSLPDKLVTFTATFTDPDGFLNLRFADIIINTSPDGNQCCFVEYDQNNNKLYLRNDDNTGWLESYAPGSWEVIENSFVKLYCHETQASGNNDTLTIAYTFMLKSSFAGAKNLYLYTKDDANYPDGWINKGTWTIPVSDIILPEGTIKINNDATYSNSTSVVLNLSGQDDPGGSGLSQMRFSNDGSSWSTPEAYATSKTWTLTSDDGTKTVYVKYKDLAGNWSQSFSDTIILDTIPPAIPTINPVISPTKINCQTITGTKSSDNATIIVDCSTAIVGAVTYPTANTWICTLSNLSPDKNDISLQAEDSAGNLSACVSSSIVYEVIPAKAFLNSNQYSLLNELLDTHLNYFLSPDVITQSGLPLGAYKESDRGRYSYCNSTEWGYSLLAAIIAAEVGKINKEEAVTRIEKALDTMLLLQNDPQQNYQKLFYPYYYVTDRQGNDLIPPYHDANLNIPSIDNGFLYTSLWIIQGWSSVNGFYAIENKAASIKDNMDFRVFLQPDKLYLAHSVNAISGQLSYSKWDIYADEGGVMSWIAYLSGSVTFDEYKQLINSLLRPARSWKGIVVDEAPWFNAMFAWGVRTLAGFPVATWEADTLNLFSSASFAKSVKAHLLYGDWLGVYYPAFSDAMTQVGMVSRYTPPNIPNTVPSAAPEHIVPHAFFVPFCIGPDLETQIIENLINKITALKQDLGAYYHYGQDGHKPFGLEVTASPSKDNLGYAGVESRYIYETLSHAYTVIPLFHGININDGKPTLFHYACQNSGYLDKVKEVLSFLYTASNRILKVPQDYPTIQEAINAAGPGDSIEIAAGRYLENLQLSSKSKITLKGTIGDKSDPINATTVNTIIDSSGGLGINIINSSKVTVDNLVITGAYRDYYSSSGGAIYMDSSEDMAISNNIIIGNRAAYGAGICCYNNKRVTISQNIFRENDGHWGGAILIASSSYDPEFSVKVLDNEIINNKAWAEGAGIWVRNNEVSVCRNVIYNNVSDWAGGLCLISSQGEIKNNLIISNNADYKDGGGIYAQDSPVLITNNVVYKNRCSGWPIYGSSGIYILGNPTATIKNNIITENAHGGICYVGDYPPSITYNDVYNNTSDYIGCTPGIGSISEPPLFVSPDNDANPYNDDYHLQTGSPCINAGDPDPQYNDQDATRNDMGSYGGPEAF